MMHKIFQIALLIVLIPNNLYGSGSESVNTKKSTGYFHDYSSLFFTFDYSTHTNTFGVIHEAVKQPNYSAGIGFFSKHKFDISVQSIFTENGDISYTKTSTEIDFMAGYSFQPNDNLTIYPSYTHIEYSSNIHSLMSAFSDIAQLILYYNKGVYFGGLNSSMLFGNKNMFYLSVQNALGFYFDNLLFKNSLLGIQLEFDLNLSDKNYYNTLIYDLWDSESFLIWVNKEYPGMFEAVEHRIEVNGLASAKAELYSLIDRSDNSVFGPSYSITSVNFMLPVYYSIGKFMFNFTAFLIVPTFTSSFYEQNTQLLFNAGVAYSLDF